MKTPSGEECVVNYLNRKCPYAEYKTDIEVNQSGYELITVSQFVKAHYMVYLTQMNNYTNTCDALTKLPTTRRL